MQYASLRDFLSLVHFQPLLFFLYFSQLSNLYNASLDVVWHVAHVTHLMPPPFFLAAVLATTPFQRKGSTMSTHHFFVIIVGERKKGKKRLKKNYTATCPGTFALGARFHSYMNGNLAVPPRPSTCMCTHKNLTRTCSAPSLHSIHSFILA